jgi:transcriptional regulator with XRE-family HTH domain
MTARRKKTTRSRKKTRKTGARGARRKGTAKTRRKTGGTRRAAKPARKARPAPGLSERLTERFGELVEHAASGALRRAVELGGAGIAAVLPETEEMRREAGAYVRELRELAGLTRDELADALDLRDRSLLEAVEAGTAVLSFDLILRLAAIVARHDPVPVVLRLVRTYNPLLWQLLEDWGLGDFPLQYERERQFVNVLRGHDEARSLSDADFAQVLAFTRSAFETALHFARQPRRKRAGRSPARTSRE